ncbi:MAG TPA: hypothetical protein VEA60_05070 [Allosphingosinicella sp.]|nr:hypothetical protein [Allosphingosinicella sp.]
MPGWLSLLCKALFGAVLLNEIRGAVLAVPVLWTMYQSGGTLMAVWLGFCSLAGIALSVLVPLYGMRFAKRRWGARLA